MSAHSDWLLEQHSGCQVVCVTHLNLYPHPSPRVLAALPPQIAQTVHFSPPNSHYFKSLQWLHIPLKIKPSLEHDLQSSSGPSPYVAHQLPLSLSLLAFLPTPPPQKKSWLL